MTIRELIERLEEIESAHGDLWVEDAGGSLRERDDVVIVEDGKGKPVAVHIASDVNS